MGTTLCETEFYRSLRLGVESSDNLRFLVERENEQGQDVYIEDGKIEEISLKALSFSTVESIQVQSILTISLQFKKRHLDLIGKVVCVLPASRENDAITYLVEIDEVLELKEFIGQFILSFSLERLRDCFTNAFLSDAVDDSNADCLPSFELLQSVFNKTISFSRQKDFLQNMLEEIVYQMQGERAAIFLIDPKSEKLRAKVASGFGVNKAELAFDYRAGVAGSVFTTGVALNIDVNSEKLSFNRFVDQKLNLKTKSIICHPFYNCKNKVVGVVEVVNKSEGRDGFNAKDEEVIKILAMVLSSAFGDYDPVSSNSKVRKFSAAFDRKWPLIGKSPHLSFLRNSIGKIKDLDDPLLLEGEPGVGKSVYARIIHQEGRRGSKDFVEVDCNAGEEFDLNQKLQAALGGSLFLRNIDAMPANLQKKLLDILREGVVGQFKISVDCRLLASSTVYLRKMVDEGEFNRELYHYISRFYIHMEPLRRRACDIEQLLDYFINMECKTKKLSIKKVDAKALARLKNYDWPDNIREMKRLVEQVIACHPAISVIGERHFNSPDLPLLSNRCKTRMFGDLPFASDFNLSLKDRLLIVEREMIVSEIKRCNGNKSKAARAMGISREALRKKLLISGSVLKELEAKQSFK